MSTPETPLMQRVATSFQELAASAVTLNEASDELGKTIATLEAVLQRLNLGVTAWVTFRHSTSEDHLYYTYDQVGYEKSGGKWGIVIRSLSGEPGDNGDTIDGSWFFNESPRLQRVKALNKLPELLDELKKSADATTKQIKANIPHAQQLAAAITEAVKPAVSHK